MKLKIDQYRTLIKSSIHYLLVLVFIKYQFSNTPSYYEIHFGLPKNNIFGFAASIILLYARYVFLNNCILYYYRIKDQIILRNRKFFLLIIQRLFVGFIVILLISLTFLLLTNMDFEIRTLLFEMTLNLIIYSLLLMTLQDKTDTTLVAYSIIITLFARGIFF